MGQNAVVDWSNYLLEVCIWKLENNQNKEIGGPDLIVEIDESLLCAEKIMTYSTSAMDFRWNMSGNQCMFYNKCT